MGADFDYRIYRHNHRDDICKAFKAACEEAAHSDGYEYPGSIAAMTGIERFDDRRFVTEDAAVEHLESAHSKWSDALAVSFLLPNKRSVSDQRRLALAKLKVSKALKAEQTLHRKLVNAFWARKSEFIGCRSCKSRLSTKHLGKMLSSICVPKCPVCYSSLLSKTFQDRLSKATEKRLTADKAAIVAGVPTTITETGWVVGGWCSS